MAKPAPRSPRIRPDWRVVPGGGPPPRPQAAAEVGILLWLILSLIVVSRGTARLELTPFVRLAAVVISRDLGLLALVLYFVWRDGTPFARVGWRRQHAWREALLGLVLFVPVSVGLAWLGLALQRAGLSGSGPGHHALQPPATRLGLVFGCLLVLVVAVTEETVFRGFLYRRLQGLLGSAVAAALLSSAVFACGHGYEGVSGMIAAGVFGVVMAGIFAWRGSLVAPMVIHALQDLVAVVLLPWLLTR